MKIWQEDKLEVIRKLNSNLEIGLSSEEVEVRLKQLGSNELELEKKESIVIKFIKQFNDFTVIILLIASIISGIISLQSGESYVDTIVIWIVLLINALIGTIEEIKAEKSLDSLKKMNSNITKVLRNGAYENVDSKNLVVGDICILEAGNLVNADMRIIESINLKVEESALTGESIAVNKISEVIEDENLSIGDRKNLIFSSSMVIYGRCVAIVVATGMDTEMGKIAKMLNTAEKRKTPIEQNLEHIGKILSMSCIIICLLIFIVGLINGKEILSMIMLSISLAVAAIPEGLPTITSMVLAIGVQNLAKKKAIVKKIPAVETLGSSTVICSDKTGTLTENKMTVVNIFINNKLYTENIYNNAEFIDDLTFKKMIFSGMLCNDSKVSESGEIIGEATEIALVKYGFESGFKGDKLHLFKRVFEIPFDSKRKMMSTVNLIDGKYYLLIKGAVDELLKITDKIEIQNKVRNITEKDKVEIEAKNKYMASEALRVIACGYKVFDTEEELNTEIKKNEKNIDDEKYNNFFEKNIIFLGLFGMMDNPRKEVRETILECKKAGIKTVMITGDHLITAFAIAKKLEIAKNENECITGIELENMTDEELENRIYDISVYARVSPEHKVRIVKAFQNKNEIVAMTGDGVNDAPALKNADIGCAMGITGTDVSKEAADLVIADDNFVSIVNAIKEGRKIFDNILKSIHFLLASNIGEIISIFLCIMFAPIIAKIFNIPHKYIADLVPLVPIQILWVNLVTDTFPALALALDPAKKDIMEKRKKKNKSNIFSKNLFYQVIYQGILVGIVVFISFIIGIANNTNNIELGIKTGRTMAFFTMTLTQIVLVFNIRNDKKTVFSKEIYSNKYLILAAVISTLLMLIVAFIPFLREIFGIILLGKDLLFELLVLIFTPMLVIEIFKLLKINEIEK